MADRQTVSAEVEVAAPEDRAALEAENALLQFDRVLDIIDETVRDKRPFKLRPSTVLSLHAEAMRGVHPQAGTFRNAPVDIQGSSHKPPPEHMVAIHVENMCDWVNENWSTRSAIELCAYSMWRLNWIHPFADGNGRTSRAVAYLVLCIKAEARLPGTPTIPEQIAEDKAPYYDALEDADKASTDDEPKLDALLSLLDKYLTKQLAGLLIAATSVDAGTNAMRKFH
jgi:Fic family protein